jgi:hypothetical protein
MRIVQIAGIVLAFGFLAGCNTLKGSKLLAPQAFGMVPIAHNIYVEAGTNDASRRALREAMAQAETVILSAYGSVEARPIVHACISRQCLESFGGGGTFAKVYGRHILLSARGMNWHFIVHEWSHAELYQRLGWGAWRRMPQWFDEGLAVALSDAPEHSEQHWQYLNESHIAFPDDEQLRTLNSLRQWNMAASSYSDNKNAERRARGETEIHALYAAAGHALRPWLAERGTQGLIDFIAALNSGRDFACAFGRCYLDQ